MGRWSLGRSGPEALAGCERGFSPAESLWSGDATTIGGLEIAIDGLEVHVDGAPLVLEGVEGCAHLVARVVRRSPAQLEVTCVLPGP